MAIRYDKLFALMREKGLTTYRIRQDNIISQSALQSLREGESVTMDTVSALCKALECQPGDILEYTPDDETGLTLLSETKIRRECKKYGMTLKKSRIKNINIDDMGGYMLVDTMGNFVIAGSRFELTLDDVQEWLKNTTEVEGSGLKGIAKASNLTVAKSLTFEQGERQ